ncbi:MAG: cytochrome C oxidase subunit IV family protein [Pirellula sp.]|jgi:cytochrome c oxidase subunit 4|nr:cytochrome C oxidase subunit IV family protein [Pirellula sp.]
MANSHSSTADAHGHAGDAHGHGDGEFAHPAPIWMLLAVFFALLVLTFLTVFQARFDLGDLEIVLTLFIATVKAGLVIAFFMHLLWDKPLNAIVILSSLIFVSLFLGFCLMDAKGYRNNLIMDPNGDLLEKSKPASQLVKTSN